MSSTDKFVRSSMKTSTAALCQAIGWDATQLSALDVLSDLYSKYFMEVAKRIHLYSEHAGRKDANLEDAALVFEDMNVTVGELEEYVAHFDPVPFPTQLPRFPLEKESHLNFLRPGSEEVLTRQVHVHEYMPPMVSDDDSMKKSRKVESEIIAVPAEAVVEEGLEEGEVLEERVTERLSSQLNGKLKSDADTERTKDGADDSDSESSQSPIFSTKSPQSPITPKSGKRLDPSVENPALKRVRMLLEIEGNPVKEVTSVMMTSSGFLTTMREGKLPESKPPPNRDFFEPVVEKRKKIPTMKKIVEGVKKLDKERDFDRSESGLGLFEKPDSIYTTVPSFTGSARDKFDKEEDKVKEGKDRQKDKKDVSSLEKKKADKKSHKDEIRDKQKLKIFKKSLARDGEIRVKAKHMQEVEGRLNDYDKVDAGLGKDLGLDDIDSEEDFANPKSREQSSMKKSKKKKEKLIAKYKQKKLMASSRPLKLTKAQQKAMAAAALAAADSVKIFGTPDQIIKTVASQKKKRGRPKKMSAFNAAQNVLRLSSNLVKSSKLSRKQLPAEEIDIKSLVPDISINVKKVPLQPGLIPTSFSTSPVKLPNQLPPSISVTPATPNAASSPAGKDSSRHSGQFGALPSNVCSSVTITRIDMSSTQKLPTPFDNQTTPGIGSPNLNSSKSSSASSIAQSDSGITITPIVLEKQGVTSPGEKIEKGSSQVSGLAQLEQQFNIGKEQRKRDKEKRKELKKEKKKEKKEKDKSRKHEKLLDREREKTPKKEKKEKSEKKRKKEIELTSHPEAVVPKLTLRLHSATSTPVDSPNPPPIYHEEHHVPRKFSIKPIEETKKQQQRSPSPPSEIARFSPLVTRPAKKVTLPKKSPAGVVKSRKQENDGFSQAASSSSSRKRGRGRPAKGSVKGSNKTPSVSGMQAGLVTETVGSYINEDGDKVWICPACGRQDDGSPMVGCEVCDDWYHFVCVGIEVEPDQDEKWYCKKCVAIQAKKRGRR